MWKWASTRSARAVTASSASGPSARMSSVAPNSAARIARSRMLLPLADLPLQVTTTSERNEFASLTNRVEGRMWTPLGFTTTAWRRAGEVMGLLTVIVTSCVHRPVPSKIEAGGRPGQGWSGGFDPPGAGGPVSRTFRGTSVAAPPVPPSERSGRDDLPAVAGDQGSQDLEVDRLLDEPDRAVE